jgi:phage shock protein A
MQINRSQGVDEMKETEKMMFLIQEIRKMKTSIQESIEQIAYLRGKLSAYEHAFEEMFESEKEIKQ